MKGIVRVVTQAVYDEWIRMQKPTYLAAFPDKDPSAAPASATDTSKNAAAPKAMVKGSPNKTLH